MHMSTDLEQTDMQMEELDSAKEILEYVNTQHNSRLPTYPCNAAMQGHLIFLTTAEVFQSKGQVSYNE